MNPIEIKCPSCQTPITNFNSPFCPKCLIRVDKIIDAAKKGRDLTDAVYLGSGVRRSDIEPAESKFFLKDEKLIAAFSGWGDIASILSQYLIITDSRVFYWQRGMLETGNRAFYYSDISDAGEIRGLLWGGIQLNIHGAFETFPNMESRDIPTAVNIIREQIQKNRTEKLLPKETSIPDQIKKLAELRDSGILTEQEFTMKKTELLKRL